MRNKDINKKYNIKRKAQVTLEFVFCFFIVMLIFYSCVKALQWLGKALIGPHYQQSRAYDSDGGLREVVDQMDAPVDQYTPLRLMYRNKTFGGSY
ncbi:MAG: hypothetical protein P9M07_02140 [Candidatus Aceula meridiana]|nr:hypothetical protein [Candidatus Aceula meridiana]